MRVAIAFPGCHRRGGVERVMLECANFLDSQGHETHAFATQWDETRLRPGVVRHSVAAPSRPYLMRLLGFLRQSRRDMAHLIPSADVCCGFGVEAPLGGVAWMQSVHRAWLEISGRRRNLSGRLKQRLNPAHPVILALERAYLGGRRYGKLVALTDQVKADLMRLYSVPEGDIVVIPNGFAPEEFHLGIRRTQRETMRSQLGYKENDRVVIFVANELERKGFGPLLRAMASLQDSRVHLLAVGRLDSGAYAAEIAALGMADRVRFVGPTSDVAHYYAAADVFALPTQYEAWGLVIVEAMACGLPVVTSRLAGAAKAVQEGQTGRLLQNPQDSCEIAEALLPMLQGDHTGAEAIAQSVDDYRWANVLLRYENVLTECIGQAVRHGVKER